MLTKRLGKYVVVIADFVFVISTLRTATESRRNGYEFEKKMTLLLIIPRDFRALHWKSLNLIEISTLPNWIFKKKIFSFLLSILRCGQSRFKNNIGISIFALLTPAAAQTAIINRFSIFSYGTHSREHGGKRKIVVYKNDGRTFVLLIIEKKKIDGNSWYSLNIVFNLIFYLEKFMT